MAVESRFVVIRQGVEVETFMDKKSADDYDKMLDIADGLAELLENSPVELSEKITEELSIYFAQNRDDVLVALQAKKPTQTKAAAKPKTVDKVVEPAQEIEAEKSVNKETEVPVIKAVKNKKPAKSE
jgi:dsDNA-binding SOS-regulon protein